MMIEIRPTSGVYVESYPMELDCDEKKEGCDWVRCSEVYECKGCPLYNSEQKMTEVETLEKLQEG